MSSSSPKSIAWFSRWTLTPTLMNEDPMAVRHSLIRILAATDRNSLDVRRAIELFSREHWGIHRVRMKTLLADMSNDATLLKTLEKHPSFLGEPALLALRVGDATGTLPAALTELTLWERPIHTRSTQMWRNSKAYWTAVAFAMMLISMQMAWRLAPAIKLIGQEFELERFEEIFLAYHLDRLIYLAITGTILFAIAWVTWHLATMHPKSWLRRITLWIFGDGGLQETNLLRLIAMNLDSGVSAASTIGNCARLHDDIRIKRKLHIASDSIAKGSGEWQSLVVAKLLQPIERDAIAASNLPDVQAWTLRHLALRRRENSHFHSLRRNMWTQPVVTLLFGAFVLMVAYTVFSTLSQMVLITAERLQ